MSSGSISVDANCDTERNSGGPAGRPDGSDEGGQQQNECVLARYGNVPQVARFACQGFSPRRGDDVVVHTDRGLEIARVLEKISGVSEDQFTGEVLRIAEADDEKLSAELRNQAENDFSGWIRRVSDWKLELELIDLEWTLDRKLLLYVLNDRGAETTRLALLVAANGLGVVVVQPVTADGLVPAASSGGGCGSGGGGCGSGGCGSH